MKKISSEQILKFLSYVVVGGLATIVEWIGYRIFSNLLGIDYLLATVLAIIVSTFSNWLFGRLITFKNAQGGQIAAEIIKVYAASIVGLLLNLLIMWLLHGQLGVNDMLAKIFATGIVFAYNYLVRVLVIYKKQ